MKITLCIHLDPKRLPPEAKLTEVHVRLADGFARLLNREDLNAVTGFDLSIHRDSDDPDIDVHHAMVWNHLFGDKTWKNTQNDPG